MELYKKIIEVMKDVEYLKKDDSVGTGNSSYKAISEEKVTNTVRKSLIKNNLVILPVKQERRESFTEYEKENSYKGTVEKKQRLMSEVDVTYRIINAENPDEFVEVISSGSGVDTQDKGIGKAMTYSYKYMLLRSLAIPTGEDPDKIHNTEIEKETTVKKVMTNNQIAEKLAKEKPPVIQNILNHYKVKEISELNGEQLQELSKKMKWS